MATAQQKDLVTKIKIGALKGTMTFPAESSNVIVEIAGQQFVFDGEEKMSDVQSYLEVELNQTRH